VRQCYDFGVTLAIAVEGGEPPFFPTLSQQPVP
jgi:hypothetical protein